MESVSRPFQPRRLSNSNQYEDVLSGKRNKQHVSSINVEDYREIFGSYNTSFSSSCSIPVLNLSTSLLPQHDDVFSINFRSSSSIPDYNDIFGCNNNHHQQLTAAADNVVSYDQQLFGPDKTAKSPSSTTLTSQDLDDISHQSSDVLKQFNMSYNKISPKSKDGLDGTKHVTQLHATPGYTCFVDEPVQPKMEAKKHKSSPVCVSVDSSTKVESVSENKKFKTFDIDFKRRPSTVSSASTLPTNIVSHKSDPMRSTVDNEACKNDSTSTYEDGELDVKSDASASAAALRKAIEKAQESIRIAKESVGRKKKGLKSYSNRSSKNSMKVESRMEDITATSTSSQGFPNFMDVEKLFGAKKVINEMNGKLSKSVHSNKVIDSTVVSSSTEYTGKTESRLLDSPGKEEYATLRSEAVDTEIGTSRASDFVHADQANSMFVDDYEGKVEVSKTATGVLENQAFVYEQDSVEHELDEAVKDEVRFTTARELVKELNNLLVSEKLEYEKKESERSKQNDNGSSLNEFEKERQEEVLDQEDVEIVDSAERHGKEGKDETSDEGIEDTSEWLESENESKDGHTQEETSKIHYDVFEIEMEMEVKENARTCDNSREESQVNLQHDFEIKQEDNLKEKSLDDTFDQEYENNSSGDDNVIEETGSTDDMETTQEVGDVKQLEETESMTEAYASEEEGLCEKTFIDQTVSDHIEDQYEVKSEENDIQSETSSGSIHDVKIEVDEAIEETTILEETNIKIPQNEMPEIRTTNEIKASHKPRVLNETQNTAEDEVGEIGPSKVSGKENSRRIDEVTAKNNRLAVDRAIREARERAFAEARERAERERAAVEKATEEVRQRMMAEALEKVAKASKPSSDRTSTQSKLRAERAAVERATSEARQRALEKAMSQKSVSDLNSSESALRSKAKLDKHNRIMERAAKALAEKEKRDLLAQKEQAERNRLSENLDADIKKWSKGKEGNLRALLSTLQYILGPQSGWQPVTTTEIISSSAVKKAYRKATLCVHPDKLQQRGASIQHKYICEKVFDLLKAAWNRFNSEER